MVDFRQAVVVVEDGSGGAGGLAGAAALAVLLVYAHLLVRGVRVIVRRHGAVKIADYIVYFRFAAETYHHRLYFLFGKISVQ